MTDRKIKQETWSVKELVSSIVHKKITKPKFQRRKKWNTVPGKNDSVPNERDYINFLFDKKIAFILSHSDRTYRVPVRLIRILTAIIELMLYNIL